QEVEQPRMAASGLWETDRERVEEECFNRGQGRPRTSSMSSISVVSERGRKDSRYDSPVTRLSYRESGRMGFSGRTWDMLPKLLNFCGQFSVDFGMRMKSWLSPTKTFCD